MKDLLQHILEGITGKKDFEIEETEEEGRLHLNIIVDSDLIGLIIGKGGNTIKAIQNILRIKGSIENKYVHLTVAEKSSK